jgi:hypothetical protein
VNFRARLKALEQRRSASNQRMRVVASTNGVPLNLANSTCRRTLAPNGLLTEIVMLDGSDRCLTNEDLERFIAGFPVEASKAAK